MDKVCPRGAFGKGVGKAISVDFEDSITGDRLDKTSVYRSVLHDPKKYSKCFKSQQPRFDTEKVRAPGPGTYSTKMKDAFD
jgi:hypothetical protein